MSTYVPPILGWYTMPKPDRLTFLDDLDKIRKWLRSNGYGNLNDWAEDSDYVWDMQRGEWLDEHGQVTDIIDCAWAAMEASNGR